MYLSDVIDKGSIAIVKDGPEYIIKFMPKGIVEEKVFKHENLQIAYMKLEEFLSISSF